MTSYLAARNISLKTDNFGENLKNVKVLQNIGIQQIEAISV